MRRWRNRETVVLRACMALQTRAAHQKTDAPPRLFCHSPTSGRVGATRGHRGPRATSGLSTNTRSRMPARPRTRTRAQRKDSVSKRDIGSTRTHTEKRNRTQKHADECTHVRMHGRTRMQVSVPAKATPSTHTHLVQLDHVTRRDGRDEPMIAPFSVWRWAYASHVCEETAIGRRAENPSTQRITRTWRLTHMYGSHTHKYHSGRILTRARAHKHTVTHKHAVTHAHTHAHTHTLTHTHTHALRHAHTLTHARTHTRLHTLTHTRDSHPRTRARTHTHTHSHHPTHRSTVRVCERERLRARVCTGVCVLVQARTLTRTPPLPRTHP